MKLFALSLLSVSLVACGGDGSALAPGAGNDPGSGTSTLQIDGSVSADARLGNAQTAADFDTEFRVRVLLNSQPVTTGTVSITSVAGTVQLAYDPNNNGEWRGQAAGYDEVYILDVASGPDDVSDVRVDGPDIHTFDQPAAGATVDSTMPLDVKWARGDKADSASIRADQLDTLSIADTGSYTLPVGALKAERDQAKENQIRLSRTNRVIPAGAAGGSQLTVSVRNEITVFAQPNPAL